MEFMNSMYDQMAILFRPYNALDEIISPTQSTPSGNGGWVSSAGHTGLYEIELLMTFKQLREWVRSSRTPKFFLDTMPQGFRQACSISVGRRTCTLRYPRALISFSLRFDYLYALNGSYFTLDEDGKIDFPEFDLNENDNKSANDNKPINILDTEIFEFKIDLLITADGFANGANVSDDDKVYDKSLFDNYIDQIENSPFVIGIGDVTIKTWE